MIRYPCTILPPTHAFSSVIEEISCLTYRLWASFWLPSSPLVLLPLIHPPHSPCFRAPASAQGKAFSDPAGYHNLLPKQVNALVRSWPCSWEREYIVVVGCVQLYDEPPRHPLIKIPLAWVAFFVSTSSPLAFSTLHTPTYSWFHSVSLPLPQVSFVFPIPFPYLSYIFPISFLYRPFSAIDSHYLVMLGGVGSCLMIANQDESRQ